MRDALTLGTRFLFGLILIGSAPSVAEKSGPAPIGEDTLIVVHPYKSWDAYGSAIKGLNRLVAEFKRKENPVVYLLDSKEPVYLSDKAPDLALDAPVGQFPNPTRGRHMTLAGGNWSYCLSNALGSLLANNTNDHVTVTIPMDAVFIFMDKQNVETHFARMSEKERNLELEQEFQTLVERYLKDRYCLAIYYEGKKIATTQGKCGRTADIILKSSAKPTPESTLSPKSSVAPGRDLSIH